MSSNSIIPMSYPSSSSSSSNSMVLSNDYERLDLKSIRVIVVSISKYITELLANADTRSSLKLRCTSKLKYQKQEFFEFSEQSVLANFYWGIDSIETAIQTKSHEERDERLRNSEQMLQVPALLDEQEITAGIPNHYLVCCSYFYLSAVKNLQKDEWQAALHFIQALLVSPKLIGTEFAPDLCESLFPSCNMHEKKKTIGRRRSLGSIHLVESIEGDYNGAMKQMARRYKDWLIYYQVMLIGEIPLWHFGSRDSSSPDNESQYFS